MESGLRETIMHHGLSGGSFDLVLDLLVDKKKLDCVHSREPIGGLGNSN